MLPHVDMLGLHVPTYPLALTIAIGVGLSLAIARGRRDGRTRPEVVAPALSAIVGGFVGAKVWSVLFELGPQLEAGGGEISLANLTGGGLSIIGGLAGGALGALVGARLRGIPLLGWVDAAAPGVALAIGVARLGCLGAGCCHGAPTLFPIALVYESWSSVARPIGVPLHAAPLYESLGCAVLGCVLFRLPDNRGLRTGVFFIAYGTLRVAVEQLRADYRGWIMGWPTTMLAAVLLVAIGVAVLAGARRRAASK